ncbi:unnamed protein product [Rotaria socialis]
MSRTQPPKSTLSKLEIQALVTSDDPSISFPKPANAKSEVWTDYSKGYYENEGLDYIICPRLMQFGILQTAMFFGFFHNVFTSINSNNVF